MIVNDVYHHRKRIHRIYKNGELVWYAGEMLPLDAILKVSADFNADSEITIVSAVQFSTDVTSLMQGSAKNNLVIAPLAVGYAEVQNNVHAEMDSSGIALPSVPLQHEGMQRVAVWSSENLMLADAAFDQHINEVHLKITKESALLCPDAMMGSQDTGFLVGLSQEASALAIWLKHVNHMGNHLVDITHHLTGAAAGARPGSHRLVAFVSASEQSAMAASSVRFSGDYESNHQVAVDGGLTETESVMLASEYDTNLWCGIDGGLTGGIKLVSLSADKMFTCISKAKAHLAVWLNPIQTGTDLYIRQVDDPWQNGTDLVLADNYTAEVTWLDPIQTDNDLYIRQVYEYERDGITIILATENWMDPIQTDSDLYIRQIHKANQTGSALVLGDSYPGIIAWRSPVQSGNDLHIGQVYESRQHSTEVDLSEI